MQPTTPPTGNTPETLLLAGMSLAAILRLVSAPERATVPPPRAQ